MKGFADLSHWPEDERIAMLADTTVTTGGIVGFVVEDDVKADRYLQKLLATHRVRLVGRGPGPVRGSILIRIGPAES